MTWEDREQWDGGVAVGVVAEPASPTPAVSVRPSALVGPPTGLLPTGRPEPLPRAGAPRVPAPAGADPQRSRAAAELAWAANQPWGAPAWRHAVRYSRERKLRMSDRLSPQDMSFLNLENVTTAMHVGSVMIFDGHGRSVDFDRLVEHVRARVALVPRYRQRIRYVPGRLANPVWVDDERFDITYHVRRASLPRPGNAEQLGDVVARLQSRHLDRSRPLWELVLVEGLAQNRFAVVTKVHQALVDGVHAVDLGQVVLDAAADAQDPPVPQWRPAQEPSLVELVAGAVADSVRRPQHLIDTLRAGVGSVRISSEQAADALGGLAQAARIATRATPRSPLNRQLTEQRRFVTVATDLADYRQIRNEQMAASRRRRGRSGADGRVTVSVNDVVLATLAGALRNWLLNRGETLPPTSVVRALVPMSIRSVEPGEDRAQALASRVSSILVDLPTGEPSPMIRLHQIAYQTKAHREAGQAVDAIAIAGMAGFAPPTLHSLGARVASGLSSRLFNLVVTNVPGPQQPLYLNGDRMLATFPVMPLARGRALSIGLTSYDGGVFYGLYGDREAVSDLDVLGGCIEESLAEMLESPR